MRSRGKVRWWPSEVVKAEAGGGREEEKNCNNCFVLPATPAKCEQDVEVVEAEKEINRSDIEYEEERRSKVEGMET